MSIFFSPQALNAANPLPILHHWCAVTVTVRGAARVIGVTQQYCRHRFLCGRVGQSAGLVFKTEAAPRQPGLGRFDGRGRSRCDVSAVEFVPGVLIDLRAVAIALAGLFGGPLAAMIAAACSAVFRYELGGAGVAGGLLSILLALMVGLFGDELARGKRGSKRKAVLITSVLVAIVPLGGLNAIPPEIRAQAYNTAAPAAALLSFVSFLIASYAITRNAALARTRALLFAAVGQAPEYFYVKESGGKIIAANRNCATAHGLEHAGLMIGKSDFDLSPARATELFEEEQIALASGQPITDKIEKIEDANGYIKYFSTSKVPVTLGNGEIAGLVGVSKDITAMKRIERELEDSLNRMEQLAFTDDLTNLHNRRSFDETMQREVPRARRSGKPTSLLLVDIDSFKKFNDRYGHLLGDECLQQVADAVAANARRPADLVARYGGEEFGVILAETTTAGAYKVAEEIRLAVRALNHTHEASIKGVVTVSIGVASMEGNDPLLSARNLLTRADEALYHAKRLGRDRSFVWVPSEGKPAPKRLAATELGQALRAAG